jgi:hypothetical protein
MEGKLRDPEIEKFVWEHGTWREAVHDIINKAARPRWSASVE